MSKRSRRASVLLGAFVLAGALAPAPPSEPDANQALAREQLKLIDQALSELDQLSKRGAAPHASSGYDLWSRRKVEATRAAGAPKSEVVAALEAYRDRLKENEQYARAMFERAVLSRAGLLDAQYQRIESEMWLNREKAR